MAPAIAILGWGALLWDRRPEFDEQHGNWEFDGPRLPIEFARISRTRKGALSLVLDLDFGAPCQVAFARSKRSDPNAAIQDLREREGSATQYIGCLNSADGSRDRASNPEVLKTIANWARKNSFDVVIWTDLPANFQHETGQPFSVAAARDYVHTLPPDAKAAAVEYVRRAPGFVITPLRTALEAETWFCGQR